MPGHAGRQAWTAESWGGGSLLGGLKASLSYPRSRHLISGWISETGMQTRNHSWRQRFGSYLHIYTRSEVMRVTEIPQRRTVKSFQHRNLTTVWQPRENAGAQRSTLRVENSLRKNLPVVGNTAVRSTEVKSPKKKCPPDSTTRSQVKWVWRQRRSQSPKVVGRGSRVEGQSAAGKVLAWLSEGKRKDRAQSV